MTTGDIGIRVSVNGRLVEAHVSPRLTLADFLREELKLTGTHLGCEHGVCGSCTVLLDGEAVRSCLIFACQADGLSVTTVEGLSPPGELNELQRAFQRHHALQCGFCTPGMLTTATALLRETLRPTAEQVREAISGNICRCTGYKPIVDAILDASQAAHGEKPREQNSHTAGPIGAALSPNIGQPMQRREDVRFLNGSSCYVDDIKRPGMLYAAVVRSAHAHAHIRKINTMEAKAQPGVAAILTFEDIDGWAKPNQIWVKPLPGFERFLQMPLARDRVLYVGEPVAVVVADDRYRAEDAAEQVVVDYEPMDAVVDVHASSTDRVLLHPAQRTNLASRYTVGRGDVDGAFARAAYRRKETFKVHRHSAVPLETRGLVAEWDASSKRMRVWGPTKILFRNRGVLAGMLKVPEDHIEFIHVDVGGSFGVRGEHYPEDFLIPFAAMRLGRPVKWIEDRREHLMATNHSREMQCELEIAVDASGCILALRGRLLVDMGAYVRPNGGVGPSMVLQLMCGPYRILNSSFEMHALMTNKTPVGSYRAPGRYESSFFRERLVDLAAADLGIEPAEFRKRNLIGPDEMPWDAGAFIPGVEPAVYDTGHYPAVMARALREFDYESLAPLRGRMIDGRLHGVGMGCFVESTGGGLAETVRLRIAGPDRIELYTGSSSAGQGHETVMVQILADEMGVHPSQATVFHGSTSFLENGGGSYHSRSVVMGGSAIVLAARKLREQIVALVAARRGLAAHTLRYKAGRIERCADGFPITTLATLAEQAQQDASIRAALEASATFSNDKKLTYTFGTQLAHVAVDPETAAVEVLRFLTVEDVGRMINPAIVHGQTIGASVQGMGATFLDQFMYDEAGQLLTGSFADYLLPTSTDFPHVDAISLEESPSNSNPLGAKGAGEGGMVATAAALSNAVDEALRPLGVTVCELPLSMDNLARWIRQSSAIGEQQSP